MLDAVAQVAPHREVRQKQRVLENIANAALVNGKIDLCLAVIEWLTANENAATVWLLQSGDEIEEAGFSGS